MLEIHIPKGFSTSFGFSAFCEQHLVLSVNTVAGFIIYGKHIIAAHRHTSN